MGVVVKFGETKVGALEGFKQYIEAAQLEDMVNDEGIPMVDAYARDLPQQYAHILASSVQESIAQSAVNLLSVRKRETFLARHDFLGKAAIVGAAGIVANFSILQGRITGFAVGSAGALLLVAHQLGVRRLRSFLSSREQFALGDGDLARALGQIAGNAIHETYCSEHFDRRIEVEGNGLSD